MAMVANQNLLKIETEPLAEKKKGLTFSFLRTGAKAVVTSFSDLARREFLFLKKRRT